MSHYYPAGVTDADIDKHFATLGEDEFNCSKCGDTYNLDEGNQIADGSWLCDYCFEEYLWEVENG